MTEQSQNKVNMFRSSRILVFFAISVGLFGGCFVFFGVKEQHKIEVSRLEGEISQFRQMTEHCRQEIEKLQNSIRSLKETAEDKAKILKEKIALNEQLQHNLDGRRKELSDAQARANIEAAKSEEFSKQNDILKKDLEAKDIRVFKRESEIANSMKNLADLTKQVQELQTKLTDLTENKKRDENEMIKTMKTKANYLENEIRVKNSKLSECEMKLSEEQRKVHDEPKTTQPNYPNHDIISKENKKSKQNTPLPTSPQEYSAEKTNTPSK